MRLPAGASAGRLDVWCAACSSSSGAAQPADFSGLLSSQAVLGGGSGAAAVVLVLDAAVLPAAEAAGDAGLTTARRLQQAKAKAGAGCSLTVKGQAYSFASCAPLEYPVEPYTMTMHTSVEAAPNGGGALLRVGLSARTKGGWAG